MAPRRLAPSFLVLAMALLASAPAAAQSERDLANARELFREGSRLAEAGTWEAARERFERSLKLKRAALTLYNLGIAQQETGKLVDAVASYREFLAQPVEPATQQYVERVGAVVVELEKRVPEILIDVRPPGLTGVEVRLDGRAVAQPGTPQRVDAGRHELEAIAPGYGEVRLSTSVPESARTTLTLTLPPPPPAPPEPSVALPVVLAAGGLALVVGGGVAFGFGASQEQSSGSGVGAMFAGNIVMGAGALAAGIGLSLLWTRPHSGARRAAVPPPWSTWSPARFEILF